MAEEKEPVEPESEEQEQEFEQETEQRSFELNELLPRMEEFVEENQKAVMISAGVVGLIIIAVIYGFVKWLPDENLKGQKAMYQAEFAFAKDSFALALNGGFSVKGFAELSGKYSWTKSGNLCNYYAGICCLNLKRYDEAIKYLNKFSTDDGIIGAQRLSAIGDAYAEKGDMDQGIKYYEKAADFSENDEYTPYFLFKTGEAYEKQKKFSDAKRMYDKIKEKYPMSTEGRDIEKYIARASAGAN
jgi:tetratricopeptide (TPR) repeat protein